MVNGAEQIDLIIEIRRHASEITQNAVADPGFKDLGLKYITVTLKTDQQIISQSESRTLIMIDLAKRARRVVGSLHHAEMLNDDLPSFTDIKYREVRVYDA